MTYRDQFYDQHASKTNIAKMNMVCATSSVGQLDVFGGKTVISFKKKIEIFEKICINSHYHKSYFTSGQMSAYRAKNFEYLLDLVALTFDIYGKTLFTVD